MRSQLHGLARTLRPHIVAWGPLAVAAVYALAWGVAEAGRMFEGTPWLLVLFTAAIALSGKYPYLALALSVGIPALQLLGALDPPTPNNWFMYNGLGAVAFIIAFSGTGWVRKLVLPVGAIVSALFAARLVIPSIHDSWSYWIGGPDAPRLNPVNPVREDFVVLLFAALLFYLAFWALGTAARALLSERAIGGVLVEAESRLEEADFELRLSQDRARISRDVHDTLAHSLAVIVSQAEGAVALSASKPEVAVEALATIATVGRSALVDVRSLVESIHEQDVTAPKPTIDDLPSVVAHVRGAGMDVDFRILGTPRALSASQDLGVFRIVQESLTNALRHGGQKGTATVTLDWQGTGLAILVASAGAPPHPSGAPSRGVGIEGMKERARLMGGWLTAEPSDGGSFLVTGYVPVPQRAAQELADA